MDDLAAAPAASPAPRRRALRVAAAALLVAACAGVIQLGIESSGGGRDAALSSASTGGAPAGGAPALARADFAGREAGADVRRVADWVVASGDHAARPFALVDKTQATLYVFAPTGRLIGAAPILLGLARGDDSAPGVGDKPIAAVRPEERTTPAGRFVSEPGENLTGEKVIWIDYDAAVSMHSVRANIKSERRLERLESPDPNDHRISYGCINVPAAFFAAVAWPSFAEGGGIIYVLPETRALADVFPALRDAGLATTAGVGAAQAPDFFRVAPR